MFHSKIVLWKNDFSCEIFLKDWKNFNSLTLKFNIPNNGVPFVSLTGNIFPYLKYLLVLKILNERIEVAFAYRCFILCLWEYFSVKITQCDFSVTTLFLYFPANLYFCIDYFCSFIKQITLSLLCRFLKLMVGDSKERLIMLKTFS